MGQRPVLKPTRAASGVDRHGADPVGRTTGCVRQLRSGLHRSPHLPAGRDAEHPAARDHGWADVGDAADSDGLGEMADGDGLGVGEVVGVGDWLVRGI